MKSIESNTLLHLCLPSSNWCYILWIHKLPVLLVPRLLRCLLDCVYSYGYWLLGPSVANQHRDASDPVALTQGIFLFSWDLSSVNHPLMLRGCDKHSSRRLKASNFLLRFRNLQFHVTSAKLSCYSVDLLSKNSSFTTRLCK